jgi:hypothetical protein
MFRQETEIRMHKLSRLGLAAAACIATAAFTAVPSQAGVMNVAPKATVSPGLSVDTVHYRHYYRRHYGHYYHHHYYRHRYGYYRYPYYNPAGALAGTAVGLATAPVFGLFGGPYW